MWMALDKDDKNKVLQQWCLNFIPGHHGQYWIAKHVLQTNNKQ